MSSEKGSKGLLTKAAGALLVAGFCITIAIVMSGKARAEGLASGQAALAIAEDALAVQEPSPGSSEVGTEPTLAGGAGQEETVADYVAVEAGEPAESVEDSPGNGILGREEGTETPRTVALYSVDGEVPGAVDPYVGIKLLFEYPADADIINPGITITDPAGSELAIGRRYNPIYKTYEANFAYPVDERTVFTLLVTAPGYEDVSQGFTVRRDDKNPHDPNYYAYLEVSMRATPAYRLGREAAAAADGLLSFGNAEGVLCITTAGGVYYQGKSSEDALEGILNYAGGYIRPGRGDLLTLRKTRYEPVAFAFVVRKGGDLRMAYFRDGDLQPVYTGNIARLKMTQGDWNELAAKLGGEAFPVASLANAWAEGLPADVLISAAFHGHLCVGTIAGYAMVETMLRLYPPGAGGTGIESTQYLVLGVPGGSDDDVFQWILDATPGKRAYVGRESTEDRNMVGFVRWNSATKKGTLVVMAYDLQGLAARFTAETGMEIREDAPSELHFNAWLAHLLAVSPESLVRILLALDGLSEEQCNYLTGGVTSTTKESARGLDMEYIEELKKQLGEAEPATYNPVDSPLTLEDISRMGEDAARRAMELFRDEMGIVLEKDDPRLFALTNAGFARLYGLPSSPAWDGICAVLGSRLSRKTLLPVHSSLLDNLWFAFSLVRGEKVYSVFLRYDPVGGKLVGQSAADGKAVNDIGPETLNDPQKLARVREVFGRQFGSIQSIANAMRYDPPYEMVLSYLFHNHVCPGVSPSYLLADMIYEEFPLGDNERYIYLTTVNYCKEDGLIFLLGLSAGGGSYYNLRLKEGDDTRSQVLDGGSMEGIIIRWNDELQVGQAVIVSFSWPQWNTTGLNTSEARREAQIGGFIRYYKGIVSERMTAPPRVAVEAAKWITREELRAICSWSPDDARGNVLQFVKSLPDRSLSDLVAVDEAGGEESGGSETTAEAEDGSFAAPAAEGGGVAAAVRSSAVRRATHAWIPPGEQEEAPSIQPEDTAADPSVSPRTDEAEDPEGKARAYEVEEVQSSGSGSLPVAVAGFAALAALGAIGFFLALKRRA